MSVQRRTSPALRLSVVLILLFAALWIRSRWKHDVLMLFLHNGTLQSIASAEGSMEIVVSNAAVGSQWAWTVDWLSESSWVPLLSSRLCYYYPGDRVSYVGFSAAISPTSPRFIAFAFPHWIVIALGCIVPLRAAIRSVGQRRRHRAGKCPGCGYDLRATPDRCPECGHAPTPAMVESST